MTEEKVKVRANTYISPLVATAASIALFVTG